MEHRKIDYTKLSNKVIEHVYMSSHTLSEEQKHKLIQDKFDRARALSEALKKSNLAWHTDR